MTRADLVHKSNGDASRGFYAVHQLVHSCLRGRKPGRVPWCHRFPNAHSPPCANTLNKRRTRFSRKTPGSVCFKDRGKVDVRSSPATKKSMHMRPTASVAAFPGRGSCAQTGAHILSAAYTIQTAHRGRVQCAILFKKKKNGWTTRRTFTQNRKLKQGFILRILRFLGR